MGYGNVVRLALEEDLSQVKFRFGVRVRIRMRI